MFAHPLTRIRKQCLRVPLKEISVETRGFLYEDSDIRRHLETICGAFLLGFHAALDDRPDNLPLELNGSFCGQLRGFAFEGAGMGLCLLDHLSVFRKNRLSRFLDGPGVQEIYLVHVGAGWAIARLPWLQSNSQSVLNLLDPLLRWLAIDGYGFHEGFFHTEESIRLQRVPKWLTGYSRNVFDQGLGRSLWFVEGASPLRILSTIRTFSPARHSDLWSGVGLAATYAGGRDTVDLLHLCEGAGSDRMWLAQGAAFGAKARQSAGSISVDTDRGCEIFCGTSAHEAAGIADEALHALPAGIDGFRVWREQIADLVLKETGRVAR